MNRISISGMVRDDPQTVLVAGVQATVLSLSVKDSAIRVVGLNDLARKLTRYRAGESIAAVGALVSGAKGFEILVNKVWRVSSLSDES